ncbi:MULTISPECIES: L-threonylcarbamoyladenylate synthase [Jannaschia]|uniref:L-threonylcarbamoyladenylate synthase n=1 Tax=Jannaschia TaxID=188905 RepID=UPI001C7D7089|nr:MULTISPECIES: L-threonylcarbamoyladenylate synthase [unclassified Jannaschia]
MAATGTQRHTRHLRPPEGVAEAATLLRAGGLVAFPTETVYGLGADATDGRAVAAIYEAKGRPSFNPLIVHVPNREALSGLVRFGPEAHLLAERFWPGPLTLVLPLADNSALSPLVTAGLPTVAVRVPAAPLAQELLRMVGRPVAAPSANPSGRISPSRADHVLEGLAGRIDAVLNGGPCAVGLESTIVRPDPAVLLRDGGLAREDLEAVLGRAVAEDTTPGRVQAPGQLASHYAPSVSLRMGVAASQANASVHVGFGADKGDVTLSVSGDLIEAAANLFQVLHQADAMATARGTGITVSDIPNLGLGRAINDRLRRASAPR